ncbi:MAG: hypothetical protein ACJ0P4_08865 [Flavobacteriaceae bacterium]|mgnify:FL=1|tara:strand:- start:1048 stop:1758 length:711 start_codon:yes stop_codon:yes gene_type:complete
MKKLLLLFLTLTISFASAQDKGYWVCFNVNVDAEGQEAFVNALDGVFNSEFSSQFPFAVTLNEIMFTSRDNKMTHQLCFLAPNAETMDMWGGGPPPTAEGSLVQMLINEYVEFEDSILGSGLIFDPSVALSMDYFTVWQLSVEDPATVASAFIQLDKDTKKLRSGPFGLHEAIAGMRGGVTHYFVARSPKMSDFLNGREKINNSKAFMNFVTKTSPVSDVVGNFSGKIIKRWNMPQ